MSSSVRYWDERYRAGRNSGGGSRPRFAMRKAQTINALIEKNGIRSVIDWGCGDGRVLSRITNDIDYVGVDVSRVILERIASRFPGRKFLHVDDAGGCKADLALSLDVLQYLPDSRDYRLHLSQVFGSARRFVLIYATDYEGGRTSFYCRWRRWTPDVPNGWYLKKRPPDRKSPGPYLFTRPMNLSLAIMAHPRRKRFVDELVEKLLPYEPVVVWDEGNNRANTGLRSLQVHDPDADAHVVIQDDALICQDFVPALRQVVARAGQRMIGLYIGRARPYRYDVQQLTRTADRARAVWIQWRGPLWGVGIVYPTMILPELIEHYRRQRAQGYDTRVVQFAFERQIECWYTWPSLVDHRQEGNPSLVPQRTGRNRVAWNFLGEEHSALGIDWENGPVYVTQKRPTKPRVGVPGR